MHNEAGVNHTTGNGVRICSLQAVKLRWLHKLNRISFWILHGEADGSILPLGERVGSLHAFTREIFSQAFGIFRSKPHMVQPVRRVGVRSGAVSHPLRSDEVALHLSRLNRL